MEAPKNIYILNQGSQSIEALPLYTEKPKDEYNVEYTHLPSVWHDGQVEQPKSSEIIVMQDDEGYWLGRAYRLQLDFCVRWAYLNDLLPGRQ